MPDLIAVSNLKGGVGKTTTTANLAAALGAAGRRVLAIDLDGSAFALTRMFGQAPSQAPGTILEVIAGELDPAEAILHDVAPGVDLLAARRELAGLELSLVTEMGREHVLARALDERLDAYDHVLIDCPPSLGLLTVNALFTADRAVVPVSLTDPGALQGAAELRGAIDKAARIGARVKIAAAVRVKADPRRVTARAIQRALDELELPTARTSIPLSARFDNAATTGRPLVIAEPDSRGACAYRELADELTRTPYALEAIAA